MSISKLPGRPRFREDPPLRRIQRALTVPPRPFDSSEKKKTRSQRTELKNYAKFGATNIADKTSSEL